MTSSQKITDWDLAYNNSAAVADSAEFAERLPGLAAEFRASMTATGQLRADVPYGDSEREKLDLFTPSVAPVGLVVFIHGGYWMRFDKNAWSHLANGPLRRGWQVAIPSYTLCPEVGIAQITQQVAKAIDTAALANHEYGHSLPIRLIGHSAGGHLVSRILCRDAQLSDESRKRVDKVVSVSGVHDLRPLLNTSMNETLGLSEATAVSESPALHFPVENPSPLTCWVGAQELPEFIRQTSLLCNVWQGLGCSTEAVSEPGKNHFTVIEGLGRHDSPLVGKLLE